MRIIIDASQLGEKPTGIQVFTQNMLKSVSDIDKINTYEIYGTPFNKVQSGITNDKFTINKIPTSIQNTYLWKIWYQSGFSIQLSITHPDLFVSTNHVIPLFCRSPLVAIIYDITPLIVDKALGLFANTLFSLNARYTARNASAIITISQSSKRDIINYFKVKSEKIYVIYPGYDDALFTAQQNSEAIEIAKQKLNIIGNYILYAGTLQTNKNIPRLIEAFTLLKERDQINHKLVLAGKPSAGYDDITKAVRSSSANEDIILTGYVSKELLPGLLKGADVFVFPSLYEGFGIPPVEAMACGTPVITSNTSSLPEAVGDAGILIDPYDVTGLADAVYRVISDEKLRSDLRQKGLKRVKMFSWERAGREFLQTFELVGTHRNNAAFR